MIFLASGGGLPGYAAKVAIPIEPSSASRGWWFFQAMADFVTTVKSGCRWFVVVLNNRGSR